MERLGGWFERIALAMAGKKNPWGKPTGDDGSDSNGPDSGAPDSSGSGEETPPPEDNPQRGPRNPWGPATGGGKERPRRSAGIEDIFRNRGPEGPRRAGGGGGGGSRFRLPDRPGGKSWLPVGIAAIVALWLAVSITHQVGPKEEGVVTTLGQYSRTMTPGLNFTFPWPIQKVDIEQVSEIRIKQIPEGTGQRLMLTGDQNLVDLSYLIRWSIKDLKQFKFQLLDPEGSVEEVAEAAMRASVAEATLDRVLSGAGRADIEQRVRLRMQAILDAYRAGVRVQGVEIRKTDPPAEVEESFKDVSAAQQDSDAEINRAEAVAQQVLARAQGDAEAFNKVYEQYRLAPEVTRRRMYYDTMERVLRNTDKTVLEAQGVTTYLPLQELRRRAPVTPPATSGRP